MDSVLKWICYLALIVVSFLSDGSRAATYTPCTIPSSVRGDWDVMDVTRTTVEQTVTITATKLTGVTFWNKTLDYYCYLQSGKYYVFISDVTDLFDLYDVNIYFCWYLLTYSASQYRMYELTDKVLYSLEERAKAYMNTSTPTVNDICEIAFDTSLLYKQMQVPTPFYSP